MFSARLAPCPAAIRTGWFPDHDLAYRRAQRIVALRRLRILDTPREVTFDRITANLARLLGVPFACVSLIDGDRVWFKSAVGIDAVEIEREPGLCVTTIEGDSVNHIEDATLDPIAKNNSMVAGDAGIRFYVGAPLQTAQGERIGTLCAFGPDPRPMTADELELVEHLAKLVMHEITYRRQHGVLDPCREGTVLVVDDNELILTLVRRALESSGYKTLIAGNREQALAILHEYRDRIDVTILDTSLPEEEFVETFNRINDLAPNAGVILSGTRSRGDEVSQFCDVAADRFLEKPFAPDELIRVVQQVVIR